MVYWLVDSFILPSPLALSSAKHAERRGIIPGTFGSAPLVAASAMALSID